MSRAGKPSQPILLDLFCGAGGAGSGYARAGFEVVGVDVKPQNRYPFQFIEADALLFLREHLGEYDAIHASPPCQAYCALKHMPNAKKYADLIPQTRALLDQSGLPYVIENVPGAPLLSPVILCGTMFGLGTECGAELRRHRLFETNWPLFCNLKCNHYGTQRPCIEIVQGHSGGSSSRDGAVISVCGDKARDRPRTISVHGDHPRDESVRWQQRRTICVNGTGLPLSGGKTITVTGSTPQRNVVRNVARECFPVSAAREAMGIPWMTMAELSQAIPPAYTEFIGRQLLERMDD